MTKQSLSYVTLILSSLLAVSGWAAPSASLILEARAAAFRAGQWLVANQREDGSWGGDERLTARAVAALAGSGYGESERVKPAIAKAVAWSATERAAAKPGKAEEWERRYHRVLAFDAAESVQVKLPESWRTASMEQALGKQRGNGCWQDDGQDSVSATVHALLALELAAGDGLRKAP